MASRIDFLRLVRYLVPASSARNETPLGCFSGNSTAPRLPYCANFPKSIDESEATRQKRALRARASSVLMKTHYGRQRFRLSRADRAFRRRLLSARPLHRPKPPRQRSQARCPIQRFRLPDRTAARKNRFGQTRFTTARSKPQPDPDSRSLWRQLTRRSNGSIVATLTREASWSANVERGV